MQSAGEEGNREVADKYTISHKYMLIQVASYLLYTKPCEPCAWFTQQIICTERYRITIGR